MTFSSSWSRSYTTDSTGSRGQPHPSEGQSLPRLAFRPRHPRRGPNERKKNLVVPAWHGQERNRALSATSHVRRGATLGLTDPFQVSREGRLLHRPRHAYLDGWRRILPDHSFIHLQSVRLRPIATSFLPHAPSAEKRQLELCRLLLKSPRAGRSADFVLNNDGPNVLNGERQDPFYFEIYASEKGVRRLPQLQRSTVGGPHSMPVPRQCNSNHRTAGRPAVAITNSIRLTT